MLSAFRLPFRRAFRAGAPDQAKAAVGPRAGVSVLVSGLGARGTGRSYAALSRSGFLGNPVAHRAVRLVAEAAAAVPLLLYRGLPQQGARELTGHPVLTLLARPSSRATGTDLFETLYGHLLLSGNAYLEPLFLGARLAELHLLRPDRVTVVEGADGWPLAYDYRAAGVSRRIPAEGEPQPILHLKLFHPLDDLTGYAPLAAAHNALDLHNAAATWNKALLDNSARPSGALVYQPKEGGNLPPDQYERLKAELEAGYSGPLQAGRPMLLEGGLDWKAMSLTPRDMDFTDARNGAARDIALSLGVPPMDEQSRLIEQLALKKLRPALGSKGGRGGSDSAERKAAFEAYIRRGDEAALRDLDAKSMAVGSAADGGYLVTDETDSEIGTRLASISPIRQLASVRQVSSSVLKKPFAPSGMASGWVAEASARPQTDTPQLTELSFPTMELYAMPAATQALLDDAAVDIESWIASEVDIAFAEQEGAAFVAGDGTNKPKGFLAYDTVNDSAWTWGKIGVKTTGVAGGFAASGASDILLDTIYALKAGHRQNGTFVMNRKTQGEIRKFKDADGNYLWLPPAGPGLAASLMGFPIAEAEDMPDIAAGSLSIAFGDFKAAYLVVDRMGVRVLRDPYSAKP